MIAYFFEDTFYCVVDLKRWMWSSIEFVLKMQCCIVRGFEVRHWAQILLFLWKSAQLHRKYKVKKTMNLHLKIGQKDKTFLEAGYKRISALVFCWSALVGIQTRWVVTHNMPYFALFWAQQCSTCWQLLCLLVIKFCDHNNQARNLKKVRLSSSFLSEKWSNFDKLVSKC